MTDEELRRFAEAATPGPWIAMDQQYEYGRCEVHASSYRDNKTGAHCIPIVIGDASVADSRYIAAASPNTIIALLDRVKRAERDLVRQNEDAEINESFNRSIMERCEKAERDRDALRLIANDYTRRYVEASEAVRAELQARCAHAEAERDARPAISPKHAAAWLAERHDAGGPSMGWNAVVDALRAHAAKGVE